MPGMSETPAPHPALERPAAAAAVPVPEPAPLLTVLRAVSDPMRLAVLKELADGSYPPVMSLAKKLHCHPDMMGRHLQRLLKAGLVRRVNPGQEADQRSKYYQIPLEFRSTLPDGTRVLDLGHCVLRFAPVG